MRISPGARSGRTSGLASETTQAGTPFPVLVHRPRCHRCRVDPGPRNCTSRAHLRGAYPLRRVPARSERCDDRGAAWLLPGRRAQSQRDRAGDDHDRRDRRPLGTFRAVQRPGHGSGRSGSYLTAVIGTRSPSADGRGQLVFLWHGTTFVGLDSSSESLAIQAITPGKPGTIRVTYAHYGPDDALCCPSLAAVTIEYRWNGRGFTPSGMPPKRGEEAAVRLEGTSITRP
ncbi:LppP/LprE family lipoprotein [Streptomyces sp. CA-142005]|uniref:LppP/LprE family lipoprotein n=1 Tax=Streptomyces sp. CA-142005 TaxID=3240052 RepID=UPI003D8F0FDA